MNRIRIRLGLALITALFALPALAYAAETPYNLTTPTGTIAGTLALPDGITRPPVVLIIAGSGPTDRDGNSAIETTKLSTYQRLAEALAAAGIASVRYDKRGVAASAAALSNAADVRFETYVSDAASWLTKLEADQRFSSVSIAGHSEGSLVGMLAAQAKPVAAFISLEGPGFPANEILRTQVDAQLASTPELLKQNDYILAELAAGRTVGQIPKELTQLYRPSIQPYLISWFRYDPRTEIAKLHSRVTIVQGSNDVQVPVDNGKALAAAAPSATLVIVPGMTHRLNDDTATTLAGQLQGAYVDATRPLDPAVAKAIAAAALGK